MQRHCIFYRRQSNCVSDFAKSVPPRHVLQLPTLSKGSRLITRQRTSSSKNTWASVCSVIHGCCFSPWPLLARTTLVFLPCLYQITSGIQYLCSGCNWHPILNITDFWKGLKRLRERGGNLLCIIESTFNFNFVFPCIIVWVKWNTNLTQHCAGFISAGSLYMFRAQAPIIRSI